jgi:plastocyanin
VARTVLLTALALLLCGAGAGATQKARKPATHTVTIDATSFHPASLTIKAGDSVTWVNKDVMPHTATSAKAGVFDSGTLASGKSWKHTFKTAGDIAYICQFHPTMKAKLQVTK